MWTYRDIRQMEKKNISPDKALSQLESIKEGFPHLTIISSASIGKGIKHFLREEFNPYLDTWSDYLKQDKRIVKFVPASGAATRMFKDLFEFLEAPYTIPTTTFEKNFFGNIHRFAFFNVLNDCCLKNEGKPVMLLMSNKQYKLVIENLLFEKGLNYSKMPKGLIYFHSYLAGPRTAMEEHLVEGALYACNINREVNIHFTVSEEHRELFERFAAKKQDYYANRFEVDYDISFSVQKSSTDTIAADENDNPFREDGKIVFRPGGHGALIENLNDLDADVVFIKNIDNVVLDNYKDRTTQYKKLIGGLLIHYQKQIFTYLKLIDSGKCTVSNLHEMLNFLEKELYVVKPDVRKLSPRQLGLYVKNKLNRPIRVCGMVRNHGEPGGGPFLVENRDGSMSLQILEMSQIDQDDPAMKKLVQQSSHFNPVDLVCSLTNYKGESFDLLRYVDPDTGFISIKSKGGRELKALELPGLWNGAMSDWNTIFVEVPIETFNPVKTVNDLLRREHQ